MGQFPPQRDKDWIKILKKLGFTEVRRIGKGNHAHKFNHPDRHTNNYKEQPDFIIIPHKIYPQMSEYLIKELAYFQITEEDIKNCC